MKKEEYELARRIYRSKTINKYYQKSKKLGNNNIKEVFSFLNIRLLISLLMFIYFFIVFNFSILIPLILVIVFYIIFPYFVYDYPIEKRKRKLEKEAIYFFEVFELSIMSGKNIIQAFQITTDNIDSELSTEFKNALKEISLGKSFYDTFMDLSKRIPSDIIQNIILNIIEVYKTGGNITETLNRQLAFIRNKRITDIKSQINQIPIKVSIVSVLLFIPFILLMILSPVILKYLAG